MYVWIKKYLQATSGSSYVAYTPLDIIGRYSSSALNISFVFRLYVIGTLGETTVLWLRRLSLL